MACCNSLKEKKKKNHIQDYLYMGRKVTILKYSCEPFLEMN